MSSFCLDHVFLVIYSGCTTVYQLRFSTLVGKCNPIFGVQLMLQEFHITGGNFAQSANTINGWLRDFYGHNRHKLFNHTVLLISVWFNFLGAHFIWAFSLMFLFSGRGYWQN
jgi:photosystem I P700 chlorophyll a apoprotein A1